MRRMKLFLAMAVVLVAMLTAGAGPAMAQSFSNEGNVSNEDSFVITGDEVFVDDFDDEFFFVHDFEDEFFFFPFFFGFDDGFFFDDDFDDFDDGGISQDVEQDADSGEVSQEFDVS